MSYQNEINHSYKTINCDDESSPNENEKKPLLSDEYKREFFDSIKRSGVTTNDASIQTAQPAEKSKCYKIFTFIRTLTIEPFIFLSMFAYFSRSVCVTNLAIDKTCRNYYNYSAEICGNLSSNNTIKDQVEKVANDYNLYINLIHMVPGAIAMIFLGPWSDRYGRKPPLLLSTLGLLVDDIGIILNTVYFEAPIQYLLLSSAPSGLVGGFISAITLVNSMASEVSTKRSRTIKFAFVELAFGSGMALGSLVGGLLYSTKYSYYASFGVSAAGHVACVPWLIFVITETRGLDINVPWSTKIKDMFSIQNLVEGWRACIRKRENHGRIQIWLMLLSMCCIVITFECFASIAYIYTFHIYGWNPNIYSQVNTTFSMVGMAVLIIFVPICVRVFKLQDGALGFMGSLSLILKNILLGLAEKHTWIYYCGSFAGIFGALSILSVRSRMSKIVANEELGKVFSFLSTCESLIPQLGTIFITKIYNTTLEVFPGTCYFVGAVILIPAAISFLWISRLKMSDHNGQNIKKGLIQV